MNYRGGRKRDGTGVLIKDTQRFKRLTRGTQLDFDFYALARRQTKADFYRIPIPFANDNHQFSLLLF